MEISPIRTSIVFLAVYIIYMCPPIWASPYQCGEIFSTSQLSFKQPEKIEERLFSIKGEKYTTKWKLGESSAKIYLAVDGKGTKVVVKVYPMRDGWERMERNAIRQEIVATDFYVENGERVPRILNLDLSQGIVVKEYISGFSGDDLVVQQHPIIKDSLTKKMRNLEILGVAFSKWLQRTKRDAEFEYEGAINKAIWLGNVTPEIKEANMLYDVQNSEWVPIYF